MLTFKTVCVCMHACITRVIPILALALVPVPIFNILVLYQYPLIYCGQYRTKHKYYIDQLCIHLADSLTVLARAIRLPVLRAAFGTFTRFVPLMTERQFALHVEREFLEEEIAQRHTQQISLRSTSTHVIKCSSRNLNSKRKPKLPAEKGVRRGRAGKVKLATGNFPLNLWQLSISSLGLTIQNHMKITGQLVNLLLWIISHSVSWTMSGLFALHSSLGTQIQASKLEIFFQKL